MTPAVFGPRRPETCLSACAPTAPARTMSHLLDNFNDSKTKAFCSGCKREVDLYAYRSKGRTLYRCGPRAREYRRTQYEQINPEARRYQRHGPND